MMTVVQFPKGLAFRLVPIFKTLDMMNFGHSLKGLALLLVPI